MEHSVVEMMIDSQVLTVCNSFFDPFKLKSGKNSEKENQAKKQRKRIERPEEGVVRRLIG
jgi:hypothetical protein